ncbi:MAG: nucleoside transporter C-terminal domain-containing protein [Pseudomonadota bacterium]
MNEYLVSAGFSLLGILTILVLAFALSSGKRRINLRIVGAALALQAVMAIFVLRTSVGIGVIKGMSDAVSALLDYGNEGTKFLFGADNPLANTFAVGALPVIVFFASLVSILYYLGIMQRLVQWLGGAIQWVTGVSKVEALGAAANIFVGQSESPLVVRPYLADLPPSRLFTLMCVGMAGTAGTILALYTSIIGTEYLPYLLSAAFMSAPGGIVMAKIMMPDEEPKGEEGEPVVKLVDSFEEGVKPANIIEAAGQGAMTGVRLAVAVGAMVLAFVSLVALANGLMGGVGGWFGYPDLTFQQFAGYVIAPILWLLGLPWAEAQLAGGMFGTKMITNEVVAFLQLIDNAEALADRNRKIAIYALCGFANLSSIAIQMAVIGSLAPTQRSTVARLGLKALIAGAFANLMSAALASLFLPF